MAGVGDFDDPMRLRVVMFDAMGPPADELDAPEWRVAARAWFHDQPTDDDRTRTRQRLRGGPS